MRIVITGSIAYDYLMIFPGRFRDHILPDKLDSLALSFLVDTMTKQRGGVAPNIAYSLALLGGRQSIVDRHIDRRANRDLDPAAEGRAMGVVQADRDQRRLGI